MKKELRKEMMLRSKLKNKLNRERSHDNCCNFNQQHNRCLNTLQKTTKKQYFSDLNIKPVFDHKTIWKNVKSFFSDKGSNSFKITLAKQITL